MPGIKICYADHHNFPTRDKRRGGAEGDRTDRDPVGDGDEGFVSPDQFVLPGCSDLARNPDAPVCLKKNNTPEENFQKQIKVFVAHPVFFLQVGIIFENHSAFPEWSEKIDRAVHQDQRVSYIQDVRWSEILDLVPDSSGDLF